MDGKPYPEWVDLLPGAGYLFAILLGLWELARIAGRICASFAREIRRHWRVLPRVVVYAALCGLVVGGSGSGGPPLGWTAALISLAAMDACWFFVRREL